ncbi:MAG: CsgG/HfaB family protein [Halanaerobiales bacterium]
MKGSRTFLSLLSLLFLLLLSSLVMGATTVAVVDFTNNTGYYIGNIEEAAADYLISYINARDDFQVVERAKLRSIITEHGFNTSGLVDQTESAIELGKLLGAEYILTGSLMNLDIEEKSFSGYGITSKNVTLTLECNIKLIDINTGAILLSDIYSSSNTYQNHSASTIKVDLRGKTRELMRNIAVKFARDLESLEKEKRDKEEVTVEFLSTPTGASVEIDGIYYGSTPVKIPVNRGVHRVVISMGGYETWDKMVNFYEGLVVNVNLGLKEEKVENEDK